MNHDIPPLGDEWRDILFELGVTTSLLPPIMHGMTTPVSSPAPVWLAIFRLIRLATHLLMGMLEVKLFFTKATVSNKQMRIQRWSARMVVLLGIKLEINGRLPATTPPNSLWVVNHISWLDVFVLNAMLPLQFVAKSEVANWPLIGWLCRHSGTLFIERESKKDLLRVNALVEEAMSQGGGVAFFPEGTTTDGAGLLPFAASLFHAASVTKGDIHPVALQYLNPQGQREMAPAYIGEMTLLQSIWQIVRARDMQARLTLLPVMNAAHLNRRELAATAHQHIESVLKHPQKTLETIL